jgi:predicted dehydrogenase
MASRLSRRRALQTVSAAAAAGYFVSGAPALASKLANEKLRLACVGATAQAGWNIGQVASQEIIAIADVDSNNLEKGSKAYAGANKYADFRSMLEKEAGRIDAVVVATPDHTHAPAAAMAMKLKKHVYCEKPLTHTVVEARTLANLAKENKLVTQMGTQIHAGDNYRRVVELVQKGAIGPIKEVHVWVNSKYDGAKLTTGTSAPATLNWDLWQGPCVERPYSEGVHPFNWRKFWDYGNGSLGDFGCHYMDLVHWALDLRVPNSVEVLEAPPLDKVSASAGLVVKFEHPARGDKPAVAVTWYDGGKTPKLLSTLKGADGKPVGFANGGQLFVGEKGMIISDYGNRLLLPADKFADYKLEPFIPNSIGHHNEWLEAIRTGGPTTCNFDYSGALTEAVLLGVLAYKAGKKIEVDAANLKITNDPSLNAMLHKEYRKGWTL